MEVEEACSGASGFRALSVSITTAFHDFAHHLRDDLLAIVIDLVLVLVLVYEQDDHEQDAQGRQLSTPDATTPPPPLVSCSIYHTVVKVERRKGKERSETIISSYAASVNRRIEHIRSCRCKCKASVWGSVEGCWDQDEPSRGSNDRIGSDCETIEKARLFCRNLGKDHMINRKARKPQRLKHRPSVWSWQVMNK